VTADAFRQLALSLPEVIESSHMAHPDFRVRKKIFATLWYPDREWAMVKLTPLQQEEFVLAHRNIFVPVPGAWGAKGYTNVHLKRVSRTSARDALVTAWRNTAPKTLRALVPPA
jgi:hypothetical protein